MTMRLFVAIELNAAVRERLAGMIERMRAMGAVGNFSRVENLHLTLAFLGETGRAAAVLRAMEAVGQHPAFPLTLERWGRFRRSSGGDIWWAGIRPEEALVSVQKDLSDRLRAAGFPLDTKPFQAHITLGREVRMPFETAKTLLAEPLQPLGFPVEQLTLMRSHRVNGLLTYTPVGRIPLAGRGVRAANHLRRP